MRRAAGGVSGNRGWLHSSTFLAILRHSSTFFNILRKKISLSSPVYIEGHSIYRPEDIKDTGRSRTL